MTAISEAIIRGIQFPVLPIRGKNDPELLQQWNEIVEELMGRGIEKCTEMHRITGLAYTTCQRHMEQVRERWTATMSAEEQQWRREKLYREADKVAQFAWENAVLTNNESVRASFLKVVLGANQRKASLVGLDKVEIKIEATVDATAHLDVVTKVEHELQLSPGALEDLGRSAALMISQRAMQEIEEGYIVDVELEPAESELVG